MDVISHQDLKNLNTGEVKAKAAGWNTTYAAGTGCWKGQTFVASAA